MNKTKQAINQLLSGIQTGATRACFAIGGKSFGIDDRGPIEKKMEADADERHLSRAALGWQPHIPDTFRSVLDTNKYRRNTKTGVITKVKE